MDGAGDRWNLLAHRHELTNGLHRREQHAETKQYAKRLLRILQQNSGDSGLATALPDHNVLTYEVTAYCPAAQTAAACALTQGDVKVR